MGHQYRPLKDEKVFETFMRDLLNEYHNTNSFQKYDVHKQDGIDVYSIEKKIVVQCKKKDINVYSDKKLTEVLKRDLINDLNKTKNIRDTEIKFTTFILATTASPSTHGEIQRYANQLALEHKIDIQFWHWGEINEMLNECPNTILAYYNPDKYKYSDERMIQFKEAYKDHLRKLENEYNFMAFRTGYANIYTEYIETRVVKLHEGRKTQKNTVELLKNVIDFKTKSQYLLIGDAGAGKSIALRTLCVDLLDRDKSILPIYVNLREWKSEIRWSEKNLPTPADLINFIKEQVCADITFSGRDFFYFNFQTIFDNGKIYWLFDSFDEIPAVLDGATPDSVVNKTLYKLISQMTGKGIILASRPIDDDAKGYFTPIDILEVQGFSSEDIEKLWNNDKRILNQIFNTPFLSGYISTPFYALLIKYFYDTNNQELPNSRWSVIHNFITNRLQEKDMKREYKSTNLNANQLITFCKQLVLPAKQTREHGIVIDLDDITNDTTDNQFEKILPVLKTCGLIRVGQNRVSFTHAIFYDYFLSLVFKDDPSAINYKQEILKKGLQREAILYYCQTSENENVFTKNIVDFCWNKTKELNKFEPTEDKYRESLSCLRFLVALVKFDSSKAKAEHIAREIENMLSIEKHQNSVTHRNRLELLWLLKEAEAKKFWFQFFTNTKNYNPNNEILIELALCWQEKDNTVERKIVNYKNYGNLSSLKLNLQTNIVLQNGKDKYSDIHVAINEFSNLRLLEYIIHIIGLVFFIVKTGAFYYYNDINPEFSKDFWFFFVSFGVLYLLTPIMFLFNRGYSLSYLLIYFVSIFTNSFVKSTIQFSNNFFRRAGILYIILLAYIGFAVFLISFYQLFTINTNSLFSYHSTTENTEDSLRFIIDSAFPHIQNSDSINCVIQNDFVNKMQNNFLLPILIFSIIYSFSTGIFILFSSMIKRYLNKHLTYAIGIFYLVFSILIWPIYTKKILNISIIFFVSVSPLFLIFASWGLFIFIYSSLKTIAQNNLLNKFLSELTNERSIIERHINLLETDQGRMIYVVKLREQLLNNKQKLNGKWINNKVPDYDNETSAILAELEEDAISASHNAENV